MTDLDELRRKLSPEQRTVLDALWEEYRDRDRWLSRAELEVRVTAEAANAARRALGAPVLRDGEDDGTPDCRLTFLGVLLGSQGSEAEDLLVRYLAYVRDRVRADATVEWVSSGEVQAALGLSAARARLLRQLIRLSHWWGGGSRFGQQEWTVGVPLDADELPEHDLAGYVRGHVLSHFLPQSALQIRPVPSRPTPEVPFAFVPDVRLARRLAADWHEAQDVGQVRGFKSAVLLAGGVLEATLRALLPSAGEVGAGLAAAVAAAVDAGLLPAVAPLPPLLADYAALIQPADRREVSRAEAEEAVHVTRDYLRTLARRTQSR